MDFICSEDVTAFAYLWLAIHDESILTTLIKHPDWVIAVSSWVLVLCTVLGTLYQRIVARETASIQLFSVLWNQYEATDMRFSRRELARLFLSKRLKQDFDESLLLFFETLGHLTRRKKLDRQMVWTTYSYDVEVFWAETQQYIIALRKDQQDRTIYEEFEYLHGFAIKTKMKRLCIKKRENALLTSDDRKQYLRTLGRIPILGERRTQQRAVSDKTIKRGQQQRKNAKTEDKV